VVVADRYQRCRRRSLGILGSALDPPQYQSSTTIQVGQALQNPNANSSDLYNGQALAQTYADLAKRQPALQGTLDALQLTWNWTVLRGMVTSQIVPGTQLIQISVVDTVPQRAQVLTNEIAHQLILQSPTAEDPAQVAQRQFVQGEIDRLQADIQGGRDEIQRLNDVIVKSNSAREVQDARDRQATLQTQITTWQAAYAQLLASQQKNTPNFLSIVETAQTPLQPIGSGLTTNVLLGMAMGLVLSGSAAYLLEYLDDTIKTEEDVRQRLGLMTLGKLLRLKGAEVSSPLVLADQPRSPAAGAYRVLRTNLEFCSIDHPLNTLMITSAGPREGKSMTAANLAIAMAQAGQSIILVDADLWNPVQHHLFELDPATGLTNVLRGHASLKEVLQTVPIERLYVLPAGPLPPNPADLLGSRRMEYLIEALREQADVIIFDTPPTMVDADAAILAAQVDGVVIVVDAGATRRLAACHSKEALEAVGANLVGVALNRVPESGRRSSYYYTANQQPKRDHLNLASLLSRFTRKGKVTGGEGTPLAKREAAESETDQLVKQEVTAGEGEPLATSEPLPLAHTRRKPKHGN
jgi:capsular exopolysaccharide synthesis family protein